MKSPYLSNNVLKIIIKYDYPKNKMTDFDFVENPLTTGCHYVRKHIFYINMIVSFVVY